MHGLLMNGILTETGKKDYARELRTWPFPPGWERLQSPIHHLRSYSLAADARWSIIMPDLLRGWLEPHYIHPKFMAEAHTRLDADSDEVVVGFIVKAYAMIAKSNSVLVGLNISKPDRDNMLDIVIGARRMYQRLCQFTSQSIIDNPRAWSTTSGSGQSRPQSMAPPLPQRPSVSQATYRAGTVDSDTALPSTEPGEGQSAPKRATQYIHNMMRPNVHMGVHYKTIADEYALPVNVNTLLGKNQHR